MNWTGRLQRYSDWRKWMYVYRRKVIIKVLMYVYPAHNPHACRDKHTTYSTHQCLCITKSRTSVSIPHSTHLLRAQEMWKRCLWNHCLQRCAGHMHKASHLIAFCTWGSSPISQSSQCSWWGLVLSTIHSVQWVSLHNIYRPACFYSGRCSSLIVQALRHKLLIEKKLSSRSMANEQLSNILNPSPHPGFPYWKIWWRPVNGNIIFPAACVNINWNSFTLLGV